MSVVHNKSNVRPWVERRTPSRDGFTVWTSEVSHSQVYRNIIDLSLFCSHFSPGNHSAAIKLRRSWSCRRSFRRRRRLPLQGFSPDQSSPSVSLRISELFHDRLIKEEMARAFEDTLAAKNMHSGSFAERTKGSQDSVIF
jgi:hypothetical protein